MATISKSSAARESTKVWDSLAQWLPPRNPDYDFWWNLSGDHLATLLDAAGYTVEKQYEALLFLYHWVIPYMGPAPAADGKVKWKTLLGLEGSPIEYSWKWNTATSAPDVRFTIEAMSQYTNTAMDPLNQSAAREMVYRIAQVVKSVDLSWASHFYSALYDHDLFKYNQEAAAGAPFGTTCLTAAEFLPGGLSLKSYFCPRKLGQKGLASLAQYEESFAKLDPDSRARAAVNEFLSSRPDKVMHPVMVSIDDIAPADARLKFYLQTPYTSFSSVRETMTLGGRVSVPEEQLQDLRSLISAVTGVDKNYPEDAEVPPYKPQEDEDFIDLPAPVSGFGFYFDIAPRAALPAIKVYVPMHHYGRDDLSLAKGITGWMKAHGRGEYCERYMTMLQRMARHRRLEDKKGLQSYVACLIKKNGELDVTTYLGPEAFDPVRVAGVKGQINGQANGEH